MSTSEIRVGRAESAERFLATDHTVWFHEPLESPTDDQLVGMPADRRFAAEVDGADQATYPGVYGVYPLDLAVPGDAGPALIPCSGLTWVGVHPDHRRQGVLTAMMRHHLAQVHDDPDVHVSALHASEPAIYGRYGYGLASLEHEVVLSRGATLVAPQLEDAARATRTRMGSLTDPGVPDRMRACHLATAELGAVVGRPEYYVRICWQPPEELRDKEPWRILTAQRDGADVGFAMFRRTHRWEKSRPAGELFVWALVGDPAARLTLLRRLLDFDLTGTVKLRAVGIDDPVLLWAGGPRSTNDVGTFDSLWVRLVDLPRALEQRAWTGSCRVVVDVEDSTAAWNHGTWRIEVADGAARVERTTEQPDLRLPVTALGAAYLGGRSLVTLLEAGLLTEHRPGATAELWRAMRADVQPTAAWMF